MTQQFPVGAVVIGHSFTVDTELNGAEGTITTYLGEMTTQHKVTDESYTCVHYRVQWQHQEEGDWDVIGSPNLKLKPPHSLQTILNLFKVRANKYNFEHYDEIKEEMEQEKTEDMETTQ